MKDSNFSLKILFAIVISLSLVIVPPVFADDDDSDTDSDSDYKKSSVIKKILTLKKVSKKFPVPEYITLDGTGECDDFNPDCEDLEELFFPDEHLQFEDGFLRTKGSVRVKDAYTFNGRIPGPEIRATVGDVLEITVRNRLPKDPNDPNKHLMTIHWHGIELDNQSDGTPVSETGIPPGKSRLYRFRVTRPGVFWYHPHVLPTDYIFSGMYGALIVESKADKILEAKGVLPKRKKTIVLSDITVANEYNSRGNTFGFGAPAAEDVEYFKDEELNTIPAVQPDLARSGTEEDCSLGNHECIVREGELVLVNGRVPNRKNIETIYLEEGDGIRLRILNTCVERFFRLRLLKEDNAPPFGPQIPYWGFGPSFLRPFGDCDNATGEGRDPLYCDRDIQPLYRVGGEGGLLDEVRLEGGINIGGVTPAVPIFDSIIRRGEELLSPADRTEVVIIAKDKEGNDLVAGDVLYLWNVDYPHGIWIGPDFFNDIDPEEREYYTNGDGDLRNRDIAARKLVKIKIVKKRGRHDHHFDIDNFAEGLALRTDPYIDDPIEELEGLATDTLEPVPFGEEGLSHEDITFGNRLADNTRVPSINGSEGHYEGQDGIIGEAVPTQGATRYANIGDVLELVYVNDTANANHPFHLHGFSFQPVSIHRFTNIPNSTPEADVTLEEKIYEYPYNEFIDNINMQPQQALVFRVRLEDRAILEDTAKLKKKDIPPYDPDNLGEGGGVGRWLFHCHITHHAGLGMISDLCVAPEGGFAEECLIAIPDRNK